SVNPNTVQKSFEELERLGVIHSVRCSGWYVNENTDAAKRELEFLRARKTEEYLTAMSQLGCTPDEIVNLINEHLGGKNE
ncbi:MAG: GntR family transcriptional regulator, partial [Clostridia bacterium]|nr:GntR family transcriptional regulator [Clostridia bacterium]